MHKVSILLPVYNGERYLKSSIESVLVQTYQNWELLVSDNCSEDGTAQIAKSYSNTDSRIVYWRNDFNIGEVPNYNKCIEKSTGDYIELFGADDLFEPTCLEKLAHCLDSNPNVAIVTSAPRLIDENGDFIEIRRPFTGTRLFSSEEAIRSNFYHLQTWLICPVMYRSTSKGTGLNPYFGIWSDVDYWADILKTGDLLYLDEVLFHYRIHSNTETLTRLKGLEFVTSVLRMVDKYKDYIVGPGASKEEVRQVVIDKFLSLTNHITHYRKMNFDSLLEPYCGESVKENVLAASSSEAAEGSKYLIHDLHDYRRAACLSFLHGTEMERNLDRLRHERDRISIDRDNALSDRDDALSRINELQYERGHLLMERNDALEGKRKLREHLDELRNEIRSLRNKRDSILIRQEENLKHSNHLQIQLDEAASENRIFLDRIEEQSKEIDRLRGEIRSLVNSRSWQVTAPLRKVTKVITGQQV